MVGSILINREGNYLYKVTKLEVEPRINWGETQKAANVNRLKGKV